MDRMIINSPPIRASRVTQAKTAYLRLLALAGNKNRLALALGITRQAVDRWRVLPEAWCARVQIIYGINPWEMRPDLFGRDEKRGER